LSAANVGSVIVTVNMCLLIAGASYANFVEDLKEAEGLRQCRYGIYDAQYTLKDGQNRNKIVFFLWYDALVSMPMITCMPAICC